jgi:hypothetical protein
MVKMRRLLLTLVLAACGTGAALGLERDCSTPEQRESHLSKLIEMADALRSGIERVPPSDADFIRREFNDASFPENRARVGIVMMNPYFYPLQVHDDVDKVIDHLKGARRGGLKQQVAEVISALAAYGSVVASLDSYIEFDSGRARRVLDGAAIETLAERRQVVPSVVGRYARCLVGHLHEP